MRKTLLALALALAVGLAVTGCATTETSGDEVAEDKSGTNAPAENTEAAEEPAEEPAEEEPTPEEQGPLSFGEPMEWEDGLWIRVSQPKRVKFGQWAAGADKFDQSVQFTVKIVNNTGATYDVSMFSTTAQSGNAEASEVFASDQGFEGSPMTKVLDGRESEFKIAYNVQNPKDIVMEVMPDWDHDPVMYATK